MKKAEKLYKTITIANLIFYLCALAPICVMRFGGFGSLKLTLFFTNAAFCSFLLGTSMFWALAIAEIVLVVLKKPVPKDMSAFAVYNALHYILYFFTIILGLGFPTQQ